MYFICPKCREALSITENSAKCKNGHSYDRARAGYFNLLLSSSGSTHGDNAEMVTARQTFLDTGAYKPLADKVAELALRYSEGNTALDIGCGEGYYTDIIERAFAKAGRKLNLSAFDISREAVRSVARRNKNIELAVASAYHMPTADASFDLITNMFSPFAREEILRALKPTGVFIMAIPGRDHLFGLKEIAYATPYKNEPEEPEILGFELIERENLKYTLTLDGAEKIRSLFMMTPYAYRTPRESRDMVLSLDKLTTEVEFEIFVYKKSE